jgi:hypothetical protein
MIDYNELCTVMAISFLIILGILFYVGYLLKRINILEGWIKAHINEGYKK